MDFIMYANALKAIWYEVSEKNNFSFGKDHFKHFIAKYKEN